MLFLWITIGSAGCFALSGRRLLLISLSPLRIIRLFGLIVRLRLSRRLLRHFRLVLRPRVRTVGTTG